MPKLIASVCRGIDGRHSKRKMTSPVLGRPDEVLARIQENAMLDDSSSIFSNIRRSFNSARFERVGDLLRRASYSSSLISEIESVLKMRFSFSTLASSSYRTDSMTSITEHEGAQSMLTAGPESRLGLTAEGVLETHRRKIEHANTAVIDMCCSENPDCVHAHIIKAIVSPWTASHALEDLYLDGPVLGRCALEEIMNDKELQQINTPDSYGNTLLFFAARCGAPLTVLFHLLERTIDINALNHDGQTFLFLLDPEHPTFLHCQCSRTPAHLSGFECLLLTLEDRSFNFSQIDYSGRSFLAYLCSSGSFDGKWLLQVLDTNRTWRERLESMLHIRDSTGMFLMQFLSLNTRNQLLIKYLAEKFPLPYAQDITSRGFKAFAREERKDRMELCNLVQSKEFIQGSTPLTELAKTSTLRPFSAAKIINTYNRFGQTPLMEYLRKATEKKFDEHSIITKTQEFLLLGANVNARARDDSTVLHLAAKRSCPQLLGLLLANGAQMNHRDNKSLTVLDYATKNFRRSQRSTAPARLTARSFQSVARLLDNTTLGLKRSGTTHNSGQWTSKGKEKMAERSFESMATLLGHGAEPTSLPPMELHGHSKFD